MNDRYVLKADRIVLPNRMLEGGWVVVQGGRFAAVGAGSPPLASPVVNAAGFTLAPGLVDIHVHGGAGADFMDGSSEAICTVARAHAGYGTTSLVLTTTTAPEQRIVETLEIARSFVHRDRNAVSPATNRGRILGVHLYGPFFGPEAVGCHSPEHLFSPEGGAERLLKRFADVLIGVTVAPEVTGWEQVARAAIRLGLRVHVGHSDATFEQFAAAVRAGASHVDHLFCAMSDKTKLRRKAAYPMRGGVLEGTLLFEHVTTEVIADGKHLRPELLHLAYRIKGPDRLALVTDCNRALDMPDGEYIFGPRDYGTRFVRRDGVGIMPDGNGLASSCVALAHCLHHFFGHVPCPMEHVIRMCTLTPARIAGVDHLVGSIEPGKFADFVLLDEELRVVAVALGGRQIAGEPVSGLPQAER